ncbi:MAG: DNA/RNA nuclease SfsA [Spirobacillus cienkowskii]|jgi:sugar fermentation stimulation protein A|uniref:Sugar fermentation stimulation protein homolog n=1 Tax=Spirobacillus cienkowskii TaxID=495820 RepID=A0A369KP80_9BACT|nr:MAG: DNA/RNA nuclease SfsA [Spirobacillus cienkowskii]
MFILKYQNELIKSKFLKRYKRFFVDVKLKSDEVLTVHCANSGSMRSCLIENTPAYILDSLNPKRKLRYSLELLQLEDGLACLNTSRANQFIEQLLSMTINKNKQRVFQECLFPYEEFQLWETFKREAVFTKETRFDFCLLSKKHDKKCWIEVKSVSLKINNCWAFPDAVTERGQKHIKDLMNAKKNGDDAWLFFVMMRGNDVDEIVLKNNFRTAHEIDPLYSNLLKEAIMCGVKVALVVPKISVQGFMLRKFFIIH